MEACLVALRGREHIDQAEPVYAPRIPDLWRVTDALTRITEILAVHPEGGELAIFMPTIDPDDPHFNVRLRTSLASTLLAGLELAREGAVSIEQEQPMAACWIKQGDAAE
jgi:segregation and condensation protein A